MLNRIISPTGDSTLDGLLSGLKWREEEEGNSLIIRYSFPQPGAMFEYSAFLPGSWSGFNNSEQELFREVLARWSEVSNILFLEVPDSGNSYGDIRIAFTPEFPDSVEGLTFALNGGRRVSETHYESTAIVGDIWINSSVQWAEMISRFKHVMSHEVGHALGLKHPFEANSQFEMPELPNSLNSVSNTVMSYDSEPRAGFTTSSENTFSQLYPETPMHLDIKAIQYLYGANMNTNSGDTTYRFDRSGEYMTIWDAGGTDTIDLSNQSTGASLVMTPGTVSSIGLREMMPQGTTLNAEANVGIAHDTWIENAIGTAFHDSISGNILNNQITGGSGDDELNGGNGTDTAIYSGNRNTYTITTEGDVTYVEGIEGRDRLSSIEMLSFNGEVISIEEALNPVSDPLNPPISGSEVNLTPNESHTAWFLLELSTPLSTNAQVNYSTRDGTAIAGQDYRAIAGIARIEAGDTHVVIQVNLIDDQIAEGNETFSLVVTNPIGGTFSNGAVELVATRTIIDNDFA